MISLKRQEMTQSAIESQVQPQPSDSFSKIAVSQLKS